MTAEQSFIKPSIKSKIMETNQSKEASFEAEVKNIKYNTIYEVEGTPFKVANIGELDFVITCGGQIVSPHHFESQRKAIAHINKTDWAMIFCIVEAITKNNTKQ